MVCFMKVSFFPDDDIARFVYAVGSIPCSNSFISNPLVNVFLAPMPSKKGKNNTKYENQHPKLIKVPVTELDIIRVGTIWKGQELGYSYYNFKIKDKINYQYKNALIDFEIDGFWDDGYIVRRNAKRSEVKFITENKQNYIIDFNYFNLPNDSFNNETGKKDIIHSYLYTFQNNGITYFIPCSEIFTSLYAPLRKDLRRMILTHTKDDIIKKYINIEHPSHTVIPNQEVILQLKENLGDTSTIFLAHLLASDYANDAFNLIKKTVEAETNNHNIYPQIKPYFTGKTLIKGTGIYLNEDRTDILILRVNYFLAPSNIKVSLIEKQKVENNNFLKVKSNIETKRVVVEKDVFNITFESPFNYGGDRKNYVSSEVQTFVQQNVITRQSHIQYVDHVNNVEDKENSEYANETLDIINPEYEKIKNLATGESVYNKKGRLSSIKLKKQIPLINSEMAPIEIFNALIDLSKGVDRILYKISNFSERSSENWEDYIINYNDFPTIIYSIHTQGKNWIIRNKSDYRKILFLKLHFMKNKFKGLESKKYYLLEIMRLTDKEHYNGFIFTTYADITDNMLHNIMIKLAEKKGILKSDNLLDYKIKINPFKHIKGQESWAEKMKRKLIEDIIVS